MRKPKSEEILVLLFSTYVWFTLLVDPTLFDVRIESSGESIYGTYVKMVGSQQNLAWISLGVATLYFFGLFIHHINVLILIHVIGTVYYAFITASFLLNYPNIGLGALGLLSLWLMYKIYNEIDISEEIKKEKIKSKNGLTDKGGDEFE